MGKGKSIFSRFQCSECNISQKVLAHHAKEGGPPEKQSRFCKKCRKHTNAKHKVLRKPAK